LTFIFGAVCRLKCGQRVTGGKILYVNKRRHGRSSSKKSRVKRIHLVFDDDGNAVDANTEGNAALLQANENDNHVPAICDAVDNCLETVCSDDDERKSCGSNKISNTAAINSVDSCSSLSTVDVVDACSSCQDDAMTTAAAAAAESENCCDETKDSVVCPGETAMNGSCLVDSVTASDDPELSKYWWQRYRLFSRFDQGIMIDRGG